MSAPPAPSLSAITSIAVLPLRDLGGPSGEEWFADGIADALRVTLARTDALTVTAGHRRIATGIRASAIKHRGPEAGLLHHSDQGCTYASEDLPALAGRARHRVQHESSRRLPRQRRNGTLLLDREVRARERFESYPDAKMQLFDSIEVFYSQRRRLSINGQISPAALERRATEAV